MTQNSGEGSMMSSGRDHLRNTGRLLLHGVGAGALCLGLGGRLAMWLFALAGGRPSVWTLPGSMRVVFAGAVFGALGVVVHALGRRALPGRALARGPLVGLGFFVVCLPGIRPPEPLTFALFLPLFVAYGVVLDRMEARARAAHDVSTLPANAPAAHAG